MTSRNSELVSIKSFCKSDNHDLYQAYRRLKYQVFVEELGWHSLVDGSGELIAKEDPFDSCGHFMIAINSEGLPIGVIRGISLKHGFPHRDLFEQHLRHHEFNAMIENICTLNALAVLPACRGKVFRVNGCSWESSIAKLLVLGIIRLFEQQNLKATIATAEGLVVRFFQKIGFLVIDRPGVTYLHPDIFTNVGLVFGSSAHLKVLDDCKMGTDQSPAIDEVASNLLKYFERCQSEALGPNTLNSFFNL